ncbi:hypothetical protein VM99_26550 [Pseudomonas chlororaphis]|uniref:Uncharacterized protein n=1 Tax=Pseudomonas chlororaphis TaxID=587753 RepID=A0A0G3GRJ5_9PSED|nr:hypothetical protein VM99_26550 [Pseudomonas chlororaphis]
MLAKASAGQDVKGVFAFKKTSVEVFLKSSDETVGCCNSPFAVEYCFVDEQNRRLQASFSDFPLFSFREQDVQEHPVSNDAKWLAIERLACQFDQLVIL